MGSLAIWTRDDAYWIDKVGSLAALLRKQTSNHTVWSKNCKYWGGINDKTVIMGRHAAGMLFTAYSSYLKPTPLFRSMNSEIYLSLLAERRRLLKVRLPHEYMPCWDGMLFGQDQICLVKKYWCPHPSAWTAKMCEDLFKSRTGRAAPKRP